MAQRCSYHQNIVRHFTHHRHQLLIPQDTYSEHMTRATGAATVKRSSHPRGMKTMGLLTANKTYSLETDRMLPQCFTAISTDHIEALELATLSHGAAHYYLLSSMPTSVAGTMLDKTQPTFSSVLWIQPSFQKVNLRARNGCVKDIPGPD